MLVKCMVDVGERHAGVSEGHGWMDGEVRLSFAKWQEGDYEKGR